MVRKVLLFGDSMARRRPDWIDHGVERSEPERSGDSGRQRRQPKAARRASAAQSTQMLSSVLHSDSGAKEALILDVEVIQGM